LAPARGHDPPAAAEFDAVAAARYGYRVVRIARARTSTHRASGGMFDDPTNYEMVGYKEIKKSLDV